MAAARDANSYGSGVQALAGHTAVVTQLMLRRPGDTRRPRRRAAEPAGLSSLRMRLAAEGDTLFSSREERATAVAALDAAGMAGGELLLRRNGETVVREYVESCHAEELLAQRVAKARAERDAEVGDLAREVIASTEVEFEGGEMRSLGGEAAEAAKLMLGSAGLDWEEPKRRAFKALVAGARDDFERAVSEIPQWALPGLRNGAGLSLAQHAKTARGGCEAEWALALLRRRGGWKNVEAAAAVDPPADAVLSRNAAAGGGAPRKTLAAPIRPKQLALADAEEEDDDLENELTEPPPEMPMSPGRASALGASASARASSQRRSSGILPLPDVAPGAEPWPQDVTYAELESQRSMRRSSARIQAIEMPMTPEKSPANAPVPGG